MNPERTRKKSLREIQLPTGLQRKTVKQYMTAAVIALLVVILAIYYTPPISLPGLAIPAALVYLAASTAYDFDRGSIMEVAVICNNVSTYPMRDTTHVTFRTDGEDPRFYSFVIPGKSARHDLLPNAPYLIYFRPEQPGTLLSFTQL